MRGKPFYFLIVILSLSVAPAHQLIAGQVQPAKRPINENDLFDFVWIGDPQISPDGSQVIFYRIVPNKERTGYDGATWTVPTGGSAPPVELFSGNGARWSPYGQSILYRRDGQLSLFSLRTKESRKLTSLPGGAGGAVWSSDGHHIAFLSSTPDKEPVAEGPSNKSDHKSDVHIITEASYHTGGRGYLNNTSHQHVFVLDIPNDPNEAVNPRQLTDGNVDENMLMRDRKSTRLNSSHVSEC